MTLPPAGTSAQAVSELAQAPLTSAPIVSVDGIGKRFRLQREWRDLLRAPFGSATSITALDDVTFDVTRNECFGVLGPNGAGKTTLFRIIAGTLPPDQGTAHIAGSALTSRRGARAVSGQVTSVMASDRTLYWRLSASENLRLYASLHGIPRSAARARVDEVLGVVALHDQRNRIVGELSTGMRQRLLIARALIPKPSVLLLDEPTRSLDPIAAREFRDFIRNHIIAATACAVLVATHSDQEAFTLCDRVAFLDHGRVVALGPIQQLAAQFAEWTYALWTRTPEHPVFTWLTANGRVSNLRQLETDSDRWTHLTMTITGGSDAASEVLNLVTAAGVRVAHFTSIAPTLAELMQRVRHDSRSPRTC